MNEQEIKVDIHGSCVSFNIVKKHTDQGNNYKLEGVKNNLYYSHVNIAGSVGEPISMIPDDYKMDIDAHFKRNLISDLKKEVIPNLLQSDASWLIIDFYDMARAQWGYRGGSYTHTALLKNVAPEYYQKIEEQIEGNFRWIDLPSFLWYDKVNQYMEQVVKKYGADHIILNRTYYNKYYIDHARTLRAIGGNTRFYGGYEDNHDVRTLEQYVIDKWKIHSIDISRFFVADTAFAGDVLSVHYEPEYYRLAGKILLAIINGDDSVPTDQMDLDAILYKIYEGSRVQDGDSEGYFACAQYPFAYYPPLDELLNALTPEQVKATGKYIMKLYQYVEHHKAHFEQEQRSKEVIQEELLDLLDQFCSE